VGVLLIVPELERSGDLAEHIAQRAVTNLGSKMSPLSRGIIQRMARSPSKCGTTPPMPTVTAPPKRTTSPRRTRNRYLA